MIKVTAKGSSSQVRPVDEGEGIRIVSETRDGGVVLGEGAASGDHMIQRIVATSTGDLNAQIGSRKIVKCTILNRLIK